MEKGIGHYKGSYYPDENGQIFLSGHRDTVFRRTGELKKGDQLKVLLPYGSFSYEIDKTKIVDQKDTSIITQQHNKEELILTTCYPFSYIGNAQSGNGHWNSEELAGETFSSAFLNWMGF